MRLNECTDVRAPPSWPVPSSSLHLANWMQFILAHPDQMYASYVHTGLACGFRIGFDRHSVTLHSPVRNHPSARENRDQVRGYIEAERNAGRLVGPLQQPGLALLHTSPIGLVPKSEPNQWRMIVDLSFPGGHSVNDGISCELSSLSYASVDDAVQNILRLGKDAQLVKLDLKQAYRNIPVHPQDQHLLAISWEGDTYVDRALPFGLRSAPKVFTAVADMIAWALHCTGIQNHIHYLDDFLLMGAPHTEEATMALSTALNVLDHLGFPVASHKTVGQSHCITFLGIVIDTKVFELRLPAVRVLRLQSLVESWCTKRSCMKKDLESLLGHLSHAATVVRPGRTFLRQLFCLLRITKAPNHYVRLTAGARADLAWWRCFLRVWNGSSFFPRPSPSHHVYSDASGTYGCGAVVGSMGYFQIEWPNGWEGVDISVKELVPVVVAAALWGGLWQGHHIRFHSDNMAVVSVLNTKTSKAPQLMHLLRCFSFYCAFYCFHVSCMHVPGAMNTAADALSRNNLPLFSSLVPQARQYSIPTALVELLITSRPDWGSQAWTQLFARSLAKASQSLH